jgi:DNA-binding MarR family transcriptional regulator
LRRAESAGLDYEYRAWLGYRRMRARLDLQLARDLGCDSGLSEPDYDVLSTVPEAPGQRMRLGDLADRMLWSKSRLSHHITRMHQRGLVTREDCADDGRSSLVVLTHAGFQAIKAAAPGHVASLREHFIDLLTADQIDTLAAITQTVLSHPQARKARAAVGAAWCSGALLNGHSRQGWYPGSSSG